MRIPRLNICVCGSGKVIIIYTSFPIEILILNESHFFLENKTGQEMKCEKPPFL